MDKVLEFAKKLISTKDGDMVYAVDATCGRGFDTAFLASLFSNVYAFDIQDEAIISTKEKTIEFNNVQIIKDSNVNICTYLNEVDAVMYNLGFLPKGDKNITTKTEDTIASLKAVLSILKKDGIVTIICYPGHEEGLKESIAVEKFLRSLDQKEYDVIKYDFINQINYPPFLLGIKRR